MSEKNNITWIKRLPDEVVLILAEQFGPSYHPRRATVNPHLLHLSSTCSRFRSILLPRIFSERSVNSKVVASAILGDPFARSLCAHVIKLRLGHVKDINHAEMARALDLMPNLRSLELWYVTLNDTIIQALSRQPRLNSLSFSDCDFDTSCDPPTVDLFAQLPIAHVEFYRMRRTKTRPTLLNSVARALGSNTLRHAEIGHEDFFIPFAQRYLEAPLACHLRSLKLSVVVLETIEALDTFCQFIAQANHVTQISFPKAEATLFQSIPLFGTNVLPNLSGMEANLRWATLFIPLRPITELRLRGNTMDADPKVITDSCRSFVQAASQSAGKVKKLAIVLEILLGCNRDLFTTLVQLEQLVVHCQLAIIRDRFPHKRDDFKQFVLDVLSCVPDKVLLKLVSFTLDIWSRNAMVSLAFDLVFQHQLVLDVVSELPPGSVLGQIQWVPDIWWNKKEDGTWSPFIPEVAHAEIEEDLVDHEVLQMMKMHGFEPVDYERAFHRCTHLE